MPRLYAATWGGIARLDETASGWAVEHSFRRSGTQCLAVDPRDPEIVYAGLREGGVWRSADGGATWRPLEALLELPSRPTWSFPPRPWTSHVRWIAPSPHDRELLLVGIELGGLMRSTDGGESWDDHRPQAARDVHCLAWHPSAPGR